MKLKFAENTPFLCLFATLTETTGPKWAEPSTKGGITRCPSRHRQNDYRFSATLWRHEHSKTLLTMTAFVHYFSLTIKGYNFTIIMIISFQIITYYKNHI